MLCRCLRLAQPYRAVGSAGLPEFLDMPAKRWGEGGAEHFTFESIDIVLNFVNCFRQLAYEVTA
jgi:hypothetical protein